MIKHQSNLIMCHLCNRPLILYGFKFRKGAVRRKKINVKYQLTWEHQGPNAYPSIKLWCHGRCDGLIADLDILVSELTEKVDSKSTKWANKLRNDIIRDFKSLIKGLVRGRSS